MRVGDILGILEGEVILRMPRPPPHRNCGRIGEMGAPQMVTSHIHCLQVDRFPCSRFGQQSIEIMEQLLAGPTLWPALEEVERTAGGVHSHCPAITIRVPEPETVISACASRASGGAVGRQSQ